MEEIDFYYTQRWNEINQQGKLVFKRFSLKVIYYTQGMCQALCLKKKPNFSIIANVKERVERNIPGLLDLYFCFNGKGFLNKKPDIYI